MQTPLDKLTDLETGIHLTIRDEHGNSYNGLFTWDSEEEVHRIDDYKLAADYEESSLYIIKPIEDEKISGFLAEVVAIEISE